MSPSAATSVRPAGLLAQLTVLFKLRIVLLLLLAALGGLFLAAGGWPGGPALALLLVCGSLSAMGASALNQFLERGSDALMNRTRRRPLVTGALRSGWVPYVATGMIVLPVLAVWPSNPALAFFLMTGAFIYVVVYTLWLKPRTSLNIVIGGAAGSAAVLSGGAAAGAWRDPGVLALAVLLFFWTPIHFWALALVYREDYARARVPMLPVTTAGRTAALWGLVHGVGAAISGLALALRPGLGWVYLAPVALATGVLLWQAIALVIQPSKRLAWRVFHTSNGYLAVVLVAIVVAAVV